MLLGTLGASMLGNLLSRKGVVTASNGNKMDFLMLPHLLTNFEIH